MRGQAHRRSTVFFSVLAALFVLGVAPVIGTAPQPVIPAGEAPRNAAGDGGPDTLTHGEAREILGLEPGA
ncbi:MAG: hypothetical protein U9O18_01085, partial [Chloroflexota bacterium]|nr:hypothetical protein [Chloroflexota bacterium]